MTLPAGPTTPKFVQAVYALTVPRRGIPQMHAKYGDAFTIDVPTFGRAVVISDPAEIRQLFLSGADKTDNNLGRVLGPGSFFSLVGEEHKRQRKLLTPPFHGRRLAAYERIFEEETERELKTWPVGREFATLPSMTRLTLNIILRAVFGAEGTEFAELRTLMPRLINIGSWLAVLPVPRTFWLWRRFDAVRREYDEVIARLIAKARDLDGRDDILAMMLQSRYDDGSAMSRSDIADQLLTLLAAGHETTATTLAWTVERLRRHPDVLRQLVEEADEGGSALRHATIVEVQRTRPVIDTVGRQIRTDGFQLGRWTVPKGYVVIVSIGSIHEDESLFPDAHAFDPHRFVDTKPDLYQWIPFGGGVRRCIGAAFATMEMDVVLRTMLREITLVPTGEPGERWRSRGVANAPAKGGRAKVYRRPATSSRSTSARSTDVSTSS